MSKKCQYLVALRTHYLSFPYPKSMKLMQHYLWLCLVLAFLPKYSNGQYNPLTKEEYIQKYYPLAIQEMKLSGVPASIKLAQAILESTYGNSELATEAFNHFGIKCKKEWTGGKYPYRDDCYNGKGEHIPCCFRVYPSDSASFKDHTVFLTSRDRYFFIFQFPHWDYKNWALGLAKSGYAGAERYGQILINIIEKNGLSVFDYLNVRDSKKANNISWTIYKRNSDDMPSVPVFVVTQKNISPPKSIPYIRKPIKENYSKHKHNDYIISALPTLLANSIECNSCEKISIENIKNEPDFFPFICVRPIFANNLLRTIVPQEDYDIAMVATKYQIKIKDLRRFNDLEKGQKLIPKQYVYLQAKRKKHISKKTHKVRLGETWYIIAQRYGIRLKYLKRLNKKIKKNPLEKSMILRLR